MVTTVTNSLMLFLCCFFGELAAESFEKMADCLYECDWYELPVDSQNYILVMIANAQKPIHYHGFGVIVLELKSFASVKIQFKMNVFYS